MSFSVYFIEELQKKRPFPVKIGYSNNPETRLEKLQTGNARQLRLAAVIPCESEDEARKLERTLHRLAGSKYRRLTGEWFLIYGSWKGLLEQSIKMCRIDNKEIITKPITKAEARMQELEILNEARARI